MKLFPVKDRRVCQTLVVVQPRRNDPSGQLSGVLRTQRSLPTAPGLGQEQPNAGHSSLLRQCFFRTASAGNDESLRQPHFIKMCPTLLQTPHYGLYQKSFNYVTLSHFQDTPYIKIQWPCIARRPRPRSTSFSTRNYCR
jgi:hypothetical protein